MGAYILRRLALIIPTLLGIMVINFALVQFVPGGPIEQIIAQIEGGGDVFEGILVAGLPKRRQPPQKTMLAGVACRQNSSHSWKRSSALTNRRLSGFCT
jgi:ABC-type microcin C transport system permease subunit YejB